MDDEWRKVEDDEWQPLVRNWYGDRQLWTLLTLCARGRLDRGPPAPPRPYRPDGIAHKAYAVMLRKRTMRGADLR